MSKAVQRRRQGEGSSSPPEQLIPRGASGSLRLAVRCSSSPCPHAVHAWVLHVARSVTLAGLHGRTAASYWALNGLGGLPRVRSTASQQLGEPAPGGKGGELLAPPGRRVQHAGTRPRLPRRAYRARRERRRRSPPSSYTCLQRTARTAPCPPWHTCPARTRRTLRPRRAKRSPPRIGHTCWRPQPVVRRESRRQRLWRGLPAAPPHLTRAEWLGGSRWVQRAALARCSSRGGRCSTSCAAAVKVDGAHGRHAAWPRCGCW